MLYATSSVQRPVFQFDGVFTPLLNHPSSLGQEVYIVVITLLMPGCFICWGFFLLQWILHSPGRAVYPQICSCLNLMLLSTSFVCSVKACHFPCSYFDPGVIHIPEPVAKSSSCEGNQGSALTFFHVKAGHSPSTGMGRLISKLMHPQHLRN